VRIYPEWIAIGALIGFCQKFTGRFGRFWSVLAATIGAVLFGASHFSYYRSWSQKPIPSLYLITDLRTQSAILAALGAVLMLNLWRLMAADDEDGF
jgi:membrane protease YdiL (CAAX protease family)